jgi:hypothetical protein
LPKVHRYPDDPDDVDRLPDSAGDEVEQGDVGIGDVVVRDPAGRFRTGCGTRRCTARLDYWARTGIVVPSLRLAAGSGSQRRYSFADLVELRTIKGLLDAGVGLPQVRVAINALKARGTRPRLRGVDALFRG